MIKRKTIPSTDVPDTAIVIIEDVLCNKCGRSCNAGTASSGPSYEHIHAVEHWGYFSDGLDTEVHSFDLCQRCYTELRRSFHIDSTVEEYCVGGCHCEDCRLGRKSPVAVNHYQAPAPADNPEDTR